MYNLYIELIYEYNVCVCMKVHGNESRAWLWLVRSRREKRNGSGGGAVHPKIENEMERGHWTAANGKRHRGRGQHIKG